MSTAIHEPGSARRPVRPLSIRNISDGVIGRFHEVLRVQPEAVAVTDTEREVTFAGVAAEAGQLLLALRAALHDLPELRGTHRSPGLAAAPRLTDDEPEPIA